jgi:tetratricopeptide (TPR) repeat protein
MKKHVGLLLLALALVRPVFAQETNAAVMSASPAISSPTEVQIRTQLFDIVCQGGGYSADTLLKELDQRFEVYNRLFRFNTSKLAAPLKVRSFTDKTAYDNYVASRLGATRDGAVYLHYNDVSRRELIINMSSPEAERVLPHQAFIQFLRAFVPYPPTWMREGFAIYYNTLRFNRQTLLLDYEENLAWLDTVKTISRERREPALESVFLADANGQTPEYFHPVAWGLVSFLLNSGGNDYYRSLTESFLLLDPNSSAADNDKIVLGRLTNYTTIDRLYADYERYIASRSTFSELIVEGQQLYAASDFANAEQKFLEALWQKMNHYAPYYYLGLVSYANKSYDMAEQYYRQAIQFLPQSHSPDDEALIQYALGVNAASAGRTDEALEFLNVSASLSPERYRARANDIIKKLVPSYPTTGTSSAAPAQPQAAPQATPQQLPQTYTPLY